MPGKPPINIDYVSQWFPLNKLPKEQQDEVRKQIAARRKPTITVRYRGELVPLHSLPQETQDEIKKRVAEKLESAIKQQVALMLQRRLQASDS